MIGFLEAQPDGSVFILGLDFQTGFIRKEDSKLTFLSSDSNNGMSPISEPLESATALKDGTLFVIGDLSDRVRILVGVDAI